MREMIEHLERAYARLSSIPLNGDSLDIMAMAKQEIREIFVMMEEKAKEEMKEEKEEMEVESDGPAD